MAAFQLRPKLSDDETHAIPDFIETAPVAKLPVLPQITEADMDTTRAKVGNWSSRTEMKGKLSDKWTGPKAVTSQAPAQAPAQAQTVTLDAAQQATDAAQTAQSSDPAADASKEGMMTSVISYISLEVLTNNRRYASAYTGHRCRDNRAGNHTCRRPRTPNGQACWSHV